MNGFIEWLEALNEKDTKVKAVLRHSTSPSNQEHLYLLILCRTLCEG